IQHRHYRLRGRHARPRARPPRPRRRGGGQGRYVHRRRHCRPPAPAGLHAGPGCGRHAMTVSEATRCRWAGTDPLYTRYHDEEWGVPMTDDRAMFEKLVLEGFQSGLSWITILRKRENFRKAFHSFEAKRVARYEAKDFARLMADPGIVRNRLKIEATIDN